MLDVEVSMEEFFCALVIGKLYLSRRLSVFPYSCADLLLYWWSHED
jgi:hypothetical protein